MTQRQKITLQQTQRLALNTSLHTSIRLLRGDSAGLTRYLEEQVADNPHLRLIPAKSPALGDWLPRWSGVFKPAQTPPDAASAAPSLIAHVITAITALNLTPPQRDIALALTESLEPSGWLARPPAAIAADLHLPTAQIAEVLARLQTLDPPGLFAQNLAECLVLQARDADQLDGPMATILANLPLLAAGDIDHLAQLADCPEETILARFRQIRAMNPKPGASFSPTNPATLREPDLLARPLKGNRWSITLNNSALPDLEVLPTPTSGTAQPEHLATARALHFALRARNSTLLRVGREIAGRQVAALNHGAGRLAPMTMADIAEALSLHESTISRVVAGASMDSPRGVWWLRQMFSGARGVKPNDPDARAPQMAAAALHHRLGQIIAAETAEFPLSDNALADQLTAETGVALARRTIAKYRTTLGIPPAHRRRRRKITRKSTPPTKPADLSG